MSPPGPQEAIQAALVAICDDMARLRLAGAGLPVDQRHLFLQAVGRLEAVFAQVAGLVEPVDVT